MDRLAKHLVAYLDERAEKITPIMRYSVLRMFESWKHAKQEEDAAKARIETAAKQDDVARQLMTIPGIGPMNASLMKTHIGDPHRFRNSRQAAASIGLVPRRYSTGGRETHRESGHLGAQDEGLGQEVRRDHLVIAAKLARICWRAMLDKSDYSPNWPTVQQA